MGFECGNSMKDDKVRYNKAEIATITISDHLGMCGVNAFHDCVHVWVLQGPGQRC